jgi:uracil-DNA glycosylase/DNA polymerase I-like protein with 3'-5' exonuclease and polymerase domains
MDHPPTMTCEKCKLYKTHPNNSCPIQPWQDKRAEIAFAQPRQPVVLFVSHYPSEQEASTGLIGTYLVDGKEWLLDYFEASTFECAMTSLVRCYPGRKGATDGNVQIKPTPRQVGVCDVFLQSLIQSTSPQVIVALGGEVLKALWPADRGSCPSVSKGRLMPVRLPGGQWLVCSFDPILQSIWSSSGGRDGQDLTEEYIRLFTLIHDILSGVYQPQAPLSWTLLKTPEEFRHVVSQLALACVTKLYVDVETNNWLGSGPSRPKPFEQDPDGTLPQKLTIYHPDTKLMCFGFTAIVPSPSECAYETCVALPSAWEDHPQLLIDLLKNRVIEAWSMSFDGEATYVLDGVVDILEGDVTYASACEADWGLIRSPMTRESLNISIDDGFLVKGLQDQSMTGNALKPTCMEALCVEDWSKSLDDDQHRLREACTKESAARKKQGLPPLPKLFSMDLTPIDIWALYNAGDTYYHARYREEKLHAASLGPDFPWKVYRMLLDGLGWIATMQRNGVPVDSDLFARTLDELESGTEGYEDAFAQLPEVQVACKESGQEFFNILSPKFMNAFVRELHGQEALEAFPRTPSGRLASDRVTIANLAGESVTAPVAWEDKTRPQRIWAKAQEWKNSTNDYSRLQGLYDYVVGERIHPTFRMLRTEMEDGEDSSVSEGAISGRIVASPNVLNLWERVKPIFRTRPGWLLMCADYGRIELAWIAWNSQDPLMMQWSNDFLDQHEQRGRIVWSLRTKCAVEGFESLSKEERKVWRAYGKTQNFATIYQEEPETTARKNLVTLEEVITDLQLGRELHPKILELMCDVYDRCQAGEMVKTHFGRCRSPRLITKEDGVLVWQTQALTAEQFFSFDPDLRKQRNQNNCRIFRSIWNSRAAQSDASDTTFCAGKRVHKLLRSGDWLDPTKIREINYQYDALHYEVREDYIATAARAVVGVMQDIPNLELPNTFGLRLPADVEVGQHYGKSKATPGYLRGWDIERGCYEE